MILYHFSPNKFYILSPQVGQNRFGGEESQVVGEPLVWLTEDANELKSKNGKIINIYRHRVLINEDDPDLEVAAAKQKLNIDAQNFFGSKPIPRWFYFKRKLLVTEISLWNAKTGHFEPRKELIPLMFNLLTKLRHWLTRGSK